TGMHRRPGPGRGVWRSSPGVQSVIFLDSHSSGLHDRSPGSAPPPRRAPMTSAAETAARQAAERACYQVLAEHSVLGTILVDPAGGIVDNNEAFRSEEHTSELQSRENLVCRLLLEKKKKQNVGQS